MDLSVDAPPLARPPAPAPEPAVSVSSSSFHTDVSISLSDSAAGAASIPRTLELVFDTRTGELGPSARDRERVLISPSGSESSRHGSAPRSPVHELEGVEARRVQLIVRSSPSVASASSSPSLNDSRVPPVTATTSDRSATAIVDRSGAHDRSQPSSQAQQLQPQHAAHTAIAWSNSRGPQTVEASSASTTSKPPVPPVSSSQHQVHPNSTSPAAAEGPSIPPPSNEKEKEKKERQPTVQLRGVDNRQASSTAGDQSARVRPDSASSNSAPQSQQQQQLQLQQQSQHRSSVGERERPDSSAARIEVVRSVVKAASRNQQPNTLSPLVPSAAVAGMSHLRPAFVAAAAAFSAAKQSSPSATRTNPPAAHSQASPSKSNTAAASATSSSSSGSSNSRTGFNNASALSGSRGSLALSTNARQSPSVNVNRTSALNSPPVVQSSNKIAIIRQVFRPVTLVGGGGASDSPSSSRPHSVIGDVRRADARSSGSGAGASAGDAEVEAEADGESPSVGAAATPSKRLSSDRSSNKGAAHADEDEDDGERDGDGDSDDDGEVAVATPEDNEGADEQNQQPQQQQRRRSAAGAVPLQVSARVRSGAGEHIYANVPAVARAGGPSPGGRSRGDEANFPPVTLRRPRPTVPTTDSRRYEYFRLLSLP